MYVGLCYPLIACIAGVHYLQLIATDNNKTKGIILDLRTMGNGEYVSVSNILIAFLSLGGGGGGEGA